MMPANLDLYAKNLALLKQNHPHIFEIINGKKIPPTGEILLSDNGQPNLTINRAGRLTTLHDMANPSDDVQPFLSLVPPAATGVAVLFGLGLGYAAIALLRERPTLHYLAIFEYDPGVFVQALRNIDLTTLLTSPKVILSLGPIPDLKALAPTSRALQLENVYALRHLPSYVTQEELQTLEAEVFEHISNFNVEGATNVHFGKTFVANRFRHLTAIHHQNLIESLENAFVDVPAILVAGGPSLDKNIHLLKQVQGKAIILGVDSVLPALLKAGVHPDFLSSVDPQELTYEKLTNTQLDGLAIPLICMSWISPKVPKSFPASTVFWTFSAKPIEAWLNVLLGGKILTGGAGTVAHLNMLAAIIMGCSPIILIGQDLSYSPSQSHTSNAFLTHDQKAETYLEASDHLFTTTAWGGGEIQTTRDFFGMKRFFERMMVDSPRTYINATEGGIHLDGAEDLPLQAAIEKYCQTPHPVLSTIVDRCSRNKPDIEKLLQEFGKTQKTVNTILTLIEKTDKTTRTALRELTLAASKHQSSQAFSQLPSPLRKKIKEIDAAHKTIDNFTHLWQILEELTLEGLRKAERLRHKISPLANNPATYVEWLRKNLERCEEINKTRTKTLRYFNECLSQVLEQHTQERELLAFIKKESESPMRLSALAALYMASADLTLANPILEKLATMIPVSAETRFYQGIIALERAEYEKGNSLLAEAIHLDPDYSEQVTLLRRKLGERYLKHAAFYQYVSAPTTKRLLLKGLRYCPGHAQIIANLLTLYRQDFQQATAALQAGEPSRLLALTMPWLVELETHTTLQQALSNDELATLHQLHGQALAALGRQKEAIDHLRQAAVRAPHQAEPHLQLMEIRFAQQQFQEGIEHLQAAVTIDRSHATHWERIGDTMAQAGMAKEAISAYEHCFIALPENLALLKKIGDCHLKLNQLEAARLAYESYKEALLRGTQIPTIFPDK